MPYLIHKDTDGSVIQFWNLHDGPLTIGRGQESSAVLDDKALSKKHLSITKEAAGYLLKDLGSSNGTMVNNKKVSEQLLKPDDQIKAGASNFVFADGLTTLAGKMEPDIKKLGDFSKRPQA